MIHSTAIIDKSVELGKDVEIGPYSIIKGEVTIGDGTKIGPHVVIEGPTEIGEKNIIYQFASIGAPPQDLKYKGGNTKLLIGNGNVFREFVTINRGTEEGGGITRIGNRNFFMAYCHVAHDCTIEDELILANNATLAGHIYVKKKAIIGGLSAIHQFSRIGEYAMIAGKTGVVRDIPPYMLASGSRAKLFGPNIVGLKRNGFSEERIKAIRKAYQILFLKKYKWEDAIKLVEEEFKDNPDIKNLLDFVMHPSSRGITRG